MRKETRDVFNTGKFQKLYGIWILNTEVKITVAYSLVTWESGRPIWASFSWSVKWIRTHRGDHTWTSENWLCWQAWRLRKWDTILLAEQSQLDIHSSHRIWTCSEKLMPWLLRQQDRNKALHKSNNDGTPPSDISDAAPWPRITPALL